MGRVALAALVLAGAGALTSDPADAASDSLGSDFWLAFTANFSTTPTLTLFVTGPVATTGTVAIPGLGFSQPFSVTPGVVSSVAVPSTAALVGSRTVENKGIHVTAAKEVTVYGLNRVPNTTDAFLGLPIDALGTDYIVTAYTTPPGADPNSEYGIVGTQANTSVTITTGNTPETITLNAGETYQVQSAGDVTGTSIVATKPVAVFAGNRCANVPAAVAACDHLVEQLAPTNAWGRRFVTVPLATRTKGDRFRITASADGTTLSINGAAQSTLARRQTLEVNLTSASEIVASKPVQVTQYSNGSEFDGVVSDPFSMSVPPYEQFLGDYTVTTPASGFSKNFINVVVPTASAGSVTLDGVAVPSSSFKPIGPSGVFSGAQLAVDLGSHRVQSPAAIGVFVYGFDNFDSYGYPGGSSVSPVAAVTTLSLSPANARRATGQSLCLTAHAADQNGNPLKDIRVDFTTSASSKNAASGFGFTNPSGDAAFCYVGTNAGLDAIRAAAGELSKSVFATWTAAAPDSDACPPGTVATVTGMVGTSGNDVIVGTAGSDTITGNGGDDLICGLGGDDKIDGGAGNDTIYAGEGNDKVNGNLGNDLLSGEAGSDQMAGSDGDDTIRVKDNVNGNDAIGAGAGTDVCVADPSDTRTACETNS